MLDLINYHMNDFVYLGCECRRWINICVCAKTSWQGVTHSNLAFEVEERKSIQGIYKCSLKHLWSWGQSILILCSECGSQFINTHTHTHTHTHTMLHIFLSACWTDLLRLRKNIFLPCRDYTAKEITNVHIYCGKRFMDIFDKCEQNYVNYIFTNISY